MVGVKYTKATECETNKHYDKKEIEYKIFIIYNHTNKNYHASYTTQKYLSRVLANLKRKDSDNMRELFENGGAMIELLDTIKTDNLYYVKERINELLHRTKKEKELSKSTFVSVWKQTEQQKTYETYEAYETYECSETTQKEIEYNGVEDLNDIDEFDEPLKKEIKKKSKKEPKKETKKEPKKETDRNPILCECCGKDISYANWARHKQSKLHIANSKK